MIDIVERLRKGSFYREESSDLMFEAADEIEHLRKCLMEIGDERERLRNELRMVKGTEIVFDFDSLCEEDKKKFRDAIEEGGKFRTSAVKS